MSCDCILPDFVLLRFAHDGSSGKQRSQDYGSDYQIYLQRECQGHSQCFRGIRNQFNLIKEYNQQLRKITSSNSESVREFISIIRGSPQSY